MTQGQGMELALAMDWGGTWNRIGAVDRQGSILWETRLANARGAGQDRLLADGQGLINQALAWCGGENRPVVGLGIAAAGPVDLESGVLLDPPNLPSLNGVSLPAQWEPLLGFPVYVGNDANLAALGEFSWGAGQGADGSGSMARTLVYVTVSTGIGGGVIDRGRLLLGAGGLAAELGHQIIDCSPNALRCQCGGYGCLEALASGTAIARIAKERVGQPASSPSSLAELETDQLTAERVFNAAGQGDPLAQEIVEDTVQALVVGFTNILHLYNPDLLALGGGVTDGLVELDLLPRINSLMLERAMSEGHRSFRLTASALGDRAGMLGAAQLVWQGSDRPAANPAGPGANPVD